MLDPINYTLGEFLGYATVVIVVGSFLFKKLRHFWINNDTDIIRAQAEQTIITNLREEYGRIATLNKDLHTQLLTLQEELVKLSVSVKILSEENAKLKDEIAALHRVITSMKNTKKTT
jgi:peptidoglycan hydrolase CwlO-like protein